MFWKFVPLLCFSSLLYLTVFCERRMRNGYKLYTVPVENQLQMETLVELNSSDTNLNFWDAVLAIAVQNKLRSTSSSANIVPSFNQQRIDAPSLDLTHFWKWQEISDYLDRLERDYPNLVSVKSIGRTFEGRDIKAIRISNGTSQNPIVLVDGAMHGREWIAPMLAVKIIYELVERSESNADILNGADWIIVPVLNIDGYIYSHEVDRFWRKTRSRTYGSECIGVDANRNFPFMWDTNASEKSKDPCSITYRGPFPASEPEIKAITSLMSFHSKSIRLYLSLHSFGQLILYPWTFEKIRIQNYQQHEIVAQRAAAAIYASSINGTKYRIGASQDYFPGKSSGVSKDYAASVGATLSFTFELPGGGTRGFDLERERIPDVLTESFAGIREFGKCVGDKNLWQ